MVFVFPIEPPSTTWASPTVAPVPVITASKTEISDSARLEITGAAEAAAENNPVDATTIPPTR
jgi:hypothetical protein